MLSSPVYTESHPCPTGSHPKPAPFLCSFPNLQTFQHANDPAPNPLRVSPSQTVTLSPTPRPRKSFIRNTYKSPRKCCNQKTYTKPNSFRCNTYKKPGGGGPALPLPTKCSPTPLLYLLYFVYLLYFLNFPHSFAPWTQLISSGINTFHTLSIA